MSKYILEVNSNIAKKIVVLGMVGEECVSTVFKIDELEELTSDYINEHFGDLQDMAYKKGLHDGESKCGYCNEYQRGLDNAWEAAKKIALMDTETSENVTGYFGLFRIMENLTPMQAIEKLKAYEEKQKAEDEIRVGDIVERYLNDKLDSTGIYLGEDDGYWFCLFWTGTVFSTFTYPKNQFKKTGRHVDIDKILEEMKK